MLISLLFRSQSLNDILSGLISFLLTLPLMMLALSVHETAHGFVAWKNGDNTAHNLGRLTLNPLKHLDPFGFLCLLIFGFGWAKPVPINARNFRNPKWGMALTALAGPAANLLLGLISTVLYGVCWGACYFFDVSGILSGFPLTVLSVLTLTFEFGALINFVYMLFNLIPVPPFDGSRFLLVFLPPRIYFGIMRYERQIMYGLLILLFVISYTLNFSPFAFVADKITQGIGTPIANLVLKVLCKSL